MNQSFIAASVDRVNNYKFTESDIKTLLIYARGRAQKNSIIKEIGDLVAHFDEKSRGLTFNHIIYCHSSVAFFTKYRSAQKIPFPLKGTCDWWLKLYLIEHLNNTPEKIVRRKLNTTRNNLLKEIKAYFDEKEFFPTELKRTPDQRFFEIVNILSLRIVSVERFLEKNIRREVKNSFESMGVIFEREILMDYILLCIFTVFHKAEFLMPSGDRGRCEIFSMKGVVYINCISSVHYDNKTFDIAFPLFCTNIATRDYFDNSLFYMDANGNELIDRRYDISFNSEKNPPIRKV